MSGNSRYSISKHRKHSTIHHSDTSYHAPSAQLSGTLLNHDELPVKPNDQRPFSHIVRDRSPNLRGKAGIKRGINVGVNLKLSPSTAMYDNSLEKLEDILAKALSGRLDEERSNTSGCPGCDEEAEIPVKRIVKPAYNCDEWNARFRICILERNIGDTVTFYLSTGKVGGSRQPNVTWKKEFHLRDSAARKEFKIEPENAPENIIIGRRGYELRVSPITETDVEYNMFSATLRSQYSAGGSKVYFMIRIVPIDLGFVYVGETIELNLRSHVSLPPESMSFRWYMEKDGEHGTLPSNMKVSFTGSSIKISELRQEQEGILACSVYTNLKFLATKKRFLLKDLVKNNDVLKSSPDHNLIFKEETNRKKRDPKLSLPMLASRVLARSKREEDVDEEIEIALMETTTEGKRPLYYTTDVTLANSYDYNSGAEMSYEHRGENSVNALRDSDDSENGFQEISHIVEDENESPKAKQIDISINREPQEVEEPLQDNSQPQNEELPPQPENPMVELNEPVANRLPKQGKFTNKQAQYDSNEDFPAVNLEKNRIQYPGNQKLSDDSIPRSQNQYASNQGSSMGNLPRSQNQYPSNQVSSVDSRPRNQNLEPARGFQQRRPLPSRINQGSVMQQPQRKINPIKNQYVDVNIETNRGKPDEEDDQSDIILNIDKMSLPREITAEEMIAKLISSCYSDFECSGSAICVRANLKKPGFCRCLPGSYGIGIFCREATWLSNNNFEMDELRNADDMSDENAST